ncbi:MAG: hypothetical protein H6739_15525 [Alphaproteobacteria bacterium]|nr:hypothetical protein [Alphaproteobacteria bacterium]
MRVLVIGGDGFMGRAVRQGLETLPETEVDSGGRGAAVRIDLRDPSTFGVLQGYDYVVNCADATIAPPDEAMGRGLECRPAFIETTSHTPTVERLLERFRGRQGHRGLGILGAGVFTGLSNLVAAEAASAMMRTRSVQLSLAFSPLAGGGGGMAALAPGMLASPAVRYIDGQRVEVPGLRKGPVVEFAAGPRATVEAAFPEPHMLHCSIDAPDIRMLWAPRPAPLGPLLRLSATLTPGFVGRSALAQGLARRLGGFVRGVLLGGLRSEVELIAEAEGPEGRHRVRFYTDDGMAAAGFAVAAMLHQLESRALRTSGQWCGLFLPDELVGLSATVDAMRTLAGDRLRLESSSETLEGRVRHPA